MTYSITFLYWSHIPDEVIHIAPPAAHEGTAEVKIRLLSRCRRQGMEWVNANATDLEMLDPSLFLLIHCHGGGFVAQSSQSHDVSYFIIDFRTCIHLSVLLID